MIDIINWSHSTSFDIIRGLTFGDTLQCLENDKYHPSVLGSFYGVRKAGSRGLYLASPVIELFQDLTDGKPWKLVLAAIAQNKLTFSKAKARLAQGEWPGCRRDYISQIWILNCVALIVAGSETSATGLFGLSYLLGSNDEAYKALAEEIRASFSNEGGNTVRSTASLAHLCACVDEALRAHPPSLAWLLFFARNISLWAYVLSHSSCPSMSHMPVPFDSY